METEERSDVNIQFTFNDRQHIQLEKFTAAGSPV